MALPKLTTPVLECTLPSDGKTIKYRPFLVKEEKILMLATTGGDKKDIINAIAQVMEECTFNEVVIDDMPVIDLEYLFVKMRIAAKGAESELKYRCNNKLDGHRCGDINSVFVDLEKLEIIKEEEDLPEKVMISEDIGITFKHPTMTDLALMNLDENATVFDSLAMCIGSVFQGDQVYADFTKAEMNEFLDSMSEKQLEKVKEYYMALPSVQLTAKFKCKKCKHEEDITIKGLQNFFV